MKKIIKLLFSLILVLVLGACGNGEPADDEGAVETETTETTEETQDPEVETEEEDEADVDTEDSTTITAATFAVNKPYAYMDENDEIVGYDVALAEAVFEEIPDYDIEFENVEFDSIFTGVSAGQYQMGVGMLSYNDERGENFYFSLPINNSPYHFVYDQEFSPMDSLADASEKGMTFYGIPGISASLMIENWNEANPDQVVDIFYIEGSGGQTFMASLENGDADFTIYEAQLLKNHYEEYPEAEEMLDSTLIDDEVLAGLPQEEIDEFVGNAQTYYIFPNTEEGDELRNQVNEILKQFYEDGTMAEIQEEYLGGDQLPVAEEMEAAVN